MLLCFRLFFGREYCNVSEIGIFQGCRNDKVYKSASHDLCPIDKLEVGDCTLGICGCHTTDNGGNALCR